MIERLGRAEDRIATLRRMLEQEDVTVVGPLTRSGFRLIRSSADGLACGSGAA